MSLEMIDMCFHCNFIFRTDSNDVVKLMNVNLSYSMNHLYTITVNQQIEQLKINPKRP